MSPTPSIMSGPMQTTARGFASKPPPDFHYQELMEMSKPKVNYRKITGDYVSTINVAGKEVLQVMVSLGIQRNLQRCCLVLLPLSHFVGSYIPIHVWKSPGWQ